MAESEKTMDYMAHIESLILEHGITVDWRESTNGRSWRKTRKVRLSVVKGPSTYAVALHEIGHVVGPQKGRSIDREAQAWRWAEQNALEWTEPMIKTAARSIASYLKAAEEGRRSMWNPPEDHDARKIAQWA